MKNLITNKIPEDTCSREVVSASLEWGHLRAFYFERGATMDDVKKIKNSVAGATVNDVAISIVGGALRKYLEAHKELPAQSLAAMAPINVRSDTVRRIHPFPHCIIWSRNDCIIDRKSC